MGPGGFVVRSFARSLGVLVAPRVFRAPEGPAAREARASLRSAPRLEARPCPPVPPAPSTPAALAVLSRPCRRPPAPRPGPAFCSSPVPSGSSGALRTGGAWCAGVWLGASARCPARPCRRPRVPQSGPVDQAARLSETAVACARECLRGRETAIAFAGTGRASNETGIAFADAGRASNETGIAFAGENWVFLARFSVALVLSVSRGVGQGCAVVMVVSRWPVSVVVEVSLVSPSPPQCVLCAKKFALLGPART